MSDQLGSTTVLCFGGPRHGDWVEVPANPPVFMVYKEPAEFGGQAETVRYIQEEVEVRFDGVRLRVQVAVCESRHGRISPEELAQFTLGHAIARLAVRPATLRDKYGTRIPR